MIHNTDSEFEFGRLVLKTPVPYSGGGGHFIKYTIQDSPLYIKPPKCHIKLVAKSSNKKRMNCDIQFSRESEDFVQWIENLENHTRKNLYDNRVKWFDSDLEEKDIQNSFVSSLKPYKSAKFYIMRTGIPIKDDSVAIKIYDEEENSVEVENLKENTEVVTIIECKGVRCSSRNFQIEYEIKQMMTQESKNPFEKCILTSSLTPIKELQLSTFKTPPLGAVISEQGDCALKMSNGVKIKNNTNSPIEEKEEKEEKEKKEEKEEKKEKKEKEQKEEKDEKKEKNEKEQDSLGKPNISIGQNITESVIKNELCEVEFNLEEMPELESVQLKKRNEVYYEMYREARRKAKVARDLALSAYLEAKRIKNTYMLDNLKDSDESDESDFDDDDDDEDDIESESENIEEDSS